MRALGLPPLQSCADSCHRADVSLGSATKRALDRSRSEASVFGPASSGGSRFQSGIDTYQAVLANSPIRAGPRDNELQPMWEQDKELEGVRTLSRGTMNLAGGLSASSTMTEGMLEDGFSTDELVDFGRTSPGKRSREEAHALVPLAEDEHEDTDVEDDDAMDEDGRASPSPAPRDGRVIRPLSARRGLQATQSVPVIGAFGSRAGRAEDFKMDADF